MASKFRSDFKQMKISDSKKPIVTDFYPLRMIADHRTEMYVKFAKVMLIFQGDSTKERIKAVSELTSKFKYAGRLISDDTYEKETGRKFCDVSTDDFYRYFKSRVKKSCEDGYNLIIINQSMTNILQMKFYFFLAQKMQYLILPYPPLVSKDNSPFRPSYSKDDLPDDTSNVRKDYKYGGETQASALSRFSKSKFEHENYIKHLFCGWFLHDVDSAELREVASLYVQDCFDNITEFNDMFSSVCQSKDFRSFYNMVDKRQDLAFCMVKILNNLCDTEAYMSTSDFMRFYGNMSRLYIVGFVISPHMIAARVRLTYDQKKLWDLDEDFDESFKFNIFPSVLLQSSKVTLPKEDVTLISSKSNRTIIAGDPIHEPTEAIHPTAKGRSCHILLGKVEGAPLQNINYDVPFAVSRERNVVKKYSDDVQPYDLERCLVRRIGKYWFVYLKETVIVNGLFASCSSLNTSS